MDESDAVTAAIENGVNTTEDIEPLIVAIVRALAIGSDHAHAKNLPQMLKVTRRMRKGGAGSEEWVAGESELRQLWGVE